MKYKYMFMIPPNNLARKGLSVPKYLPGDCFDKPYYCKIRQSLGTYYNSGWL